MVCEAGHRACACGSRAEDPHEVARLGRGYRDIFERLLANSYVDPDVGIFLLRRDGTKEWSPCWLWVGRLNREGGYPQITVRRPVKDKRKARKHKGQPQPTALLAHRVSHEEHLGVKLLPEQQLRHICNRSRCIHPNHTLPGSAYENYLDRVTAGTQDQSGLLIGRKARVPGEDDE